MFKVSVKGVVTVNGRLLLRVNERNDYELLGGKLEHTDRSLASRVRQELLEESGITVEPTLVLELWFYVFGDQAVLIVPMSCDVLDVPETLFDQDGGRLELVNVGQLDMIRLPRSYLASIRGDRPALMRLSGNPGPPYPDDLFRIELVVCHHGSEDSYPLDDACDLSERLSALGWPEARFLTVRFLRQSCLQLVFEPR